MQKFDFWGSTLGLGGFLKEGAHPKTMLKYLSVVSVDIKKKLAPYFEPNKKLIFGGSILGGPWGVFANDVKTFVS